MIVGRSDLPKAGERSVSDFGAAPTVAPVLLYGAADWASAETDGSFTIVSRCT